MTALDRAVACKTHALDLMPALDMESDLRGTNPPRGLALGILRRRPLDLARRDGRADFGGAKVRQEAGAISRWKSGPGKAQQATWKRVLRESDGNAGHEAYTAVAWGV